MQSACSRDNDKVSGGSILCVHCPSANAAYRVVARAGVAFHFVCRQSEVSSQVMKIVCWSDRSTIPFKTNIDVCEIVRSSS